MLNTPGPPEMLLVAAPSAPCCVKHAQVFGGLWESVVGGVHHQRAGLSQRVAWGWSRPSGRSGEPAQQIEEPERIGAAVGGDVAGRARGDVSAPGALTRVGAIARSSERTRPPAFRSPVAEPPLPALPPLPDAVPPLPRPLAPPIPPVAIPPEPTPAVAPVVPPGAPAAPPIAPAPAPASEPPTPALALLPPVELPPVELPPVGVPPGGAPPEPPPFGVPHPPFDAPPTGAPPEAPVPPPAFEPSRPGGSEQPNALTTSAAKPPSVARRLPGAGSVKIATLLGRSRDARHPNLRR